MPQMHIRKFNSIMLIKLFYRGFKHTLGLSAVTEYLSSLKMLSFLLLFYKMCFMNADGHLHLYTKYKSNTGWISFSDMGLHLLQVFSFSNVKTRNHSWYRSSLLLQAHGIFQSQLWPKIPHNAAAVSYICTKWNGELYGQKDCNC